MPYNSHIHHRRSMRLKNHDYSQAGLYFITICVRNRECLFGEIVNGKMQLSPLGIIANVLWHEIKNHTKNVDLGEFTIMPNHIHGIITFYGDNGDNNDNGVGARHALPLRRRQTKRAEQMEQSISSRFQNQGKNTVSSVIGSYKSAVSKHAHQLGLAFSWQRNYYEHIIRNEQSHQNISNYIIHNPEKWQEDKFYVE
jgi:REP element-mobilizing transposase RayT